MEALRVIEKVTSKIAPGCAPSFIEAQVIKALEAVGVAFLVYFAKVKKTTEKAE